jgi:hypothetical protein
MVDGIVNIQLVDVLDYLPIAVHDVIADYAVIIEMDANDGACEVARRALAYYGYGLAYLVSAREKAHAHIFPSAIERSQRGTPKGHRAIMKIASHGVNSFVQPSPNSLRSPRLEK